ncbi:hypothetical protein OCU04_004240 [Sclerotinia nivalis]|uniref:Uncharacterized protein n=1 Tax=Sclerotinia nivalis TaxID=352851 RepID=A0A9X0DKY3_9HELO|nr:hypothetical protein OCU04_004240 [Sclerotinia nivalis]
MPSTYTKFSCGHVLESLTAAGRAKEEPPQALKRTWKRILSLGMAGESTASRTRTLHQPQPERLKLGLRRVFSLGKFEPPTLTSIEECPNCKRNATFESDVYLQWVDEQPELGEGSQPEEPDQQRPRTAPAQFVPQEFQIRRKPVPFSEGSPEWRRQQAHIPIGFIRDRTHAREKVQKEADRDGTLASLEGQGCALTIPHLPLGGFWDPAEEESRIQHERNPLESDEDSI